MPALEKIAEDKLQELSLARKRRQIKTASRLGDGNIERSGEKLISFSCNDYLGLTHHHAVIAAATHATGLYGAGAGASRLITGNCPLYDELEDILAKMKHTEAACVFGSGYLANIGVIPALAGRNDLIIADRLVHSCILDGIKLSAAAFKRFSHNSLNSLNNILNKNRNKYNKCFIITETIFSMDGDIAPIAEIKKLAKKHDATLITDDAHGLGVIENSQKADIQIGTLSKAVGSYGGYVCASAKIIDYIKNSARSLIYSTALPPASIAAGIAALKIIAEDKDLRAQPLKKARLFTSLLHMKPAESAIVPLILGDEGRAIAASEALEQAGFLVAAIRPPTVAKGTARLRLAFSARHKDDDIKRLAAVIKSEGWV